MTHPNIIGNDQKSIKVCPECNHEITALSEKSRIFACPNCSSVFNSETNRRENQILGKNSISKTKNITFLEVGQIFNHRKITYKIIGRIRVKCNYKVLSYNEETGTWIYDEWICTNDKGKYLSIVHDKEGYKFAIPIEPKKRKNPETNTYLNISGKDQKMTDEVCENEILFFEGESEDALYPGKKFKSASYKYRYSIYGMEWEDARISESYVYYKQDNFSTTDLQKMITKHNELTTYNKKLANFKFFQKALNYTTLFVFIFWMISLFYDGKPIYTKSFNLKELADEEEMVAKEPFVIEDLASVYQFNLDTKLDEVNTEIYAAIEILNENQNVVNLIGHDFWRAAGYDGGERWSESETAISRYYSFPEKGTFSIVFHAETTSNSRINSKDQITLKINKGAFLSRYFIFLMVICLLFIFLMNISSIHNRVKALFF
ncbi:MAG: hypothetical protein CMO01_20490 [Thalassobius sp.]|nr:hypothetical protein [Thalassovita sp.]